MTFSFRRLIVTLVFVLLVGATVVISAFLATFDLNSFRGQLSDEISARISQTVDLGQANFSIKHGPSFAFKNVLVGTRDAALHIRAEHVFFRLEVLPLLTGKIKFTEILFEKPDVNLKIGQHRPAEEHGRRFFIDQSLLSGDLVSSVRIKDGNFRIENYRKSEKPFITALENMDVVIDDLSLRKSGWVEANGDINLNDIRSPLRVSGYIKAGNATPFWNRAHYELQVNINDLATDVLSQRYQTLIPAQIHGRTNIELKVNGIPAEGLYFNTLLTGRDLGIKLPNRPRPILSSRISVAGTWQNVEKFHKFSEMNIEFGNIELSGETNFTLAGDDPEIRIQLKAPRIALVDLNRFFESGDDEQQPDGPKFLDGSLDLKSFSFVGPASSLSRPAILRGLKNLELRLSKGHLAFNERLEISDCYSRIKWKDGHLQVEKLKFESRGLLFNSNGNFQLKIQDETGIETMTGESRLNIKNLTSTRALLPEQGLNISLHLGIIHADGTWTLQDSLLALPSIKTLLQGQWDRKNKQGLDLQITVPEFSLVDLPLVSPAIETLQPAGKMAADIRLRKTGTAPMQLSGSMKLVDAHLEIPGPLAPIDKLNGKIELNWPHLNGKHLTATLGESPIDLGIEIPDMGKAEVDLTIKGDSIRADELIFRSERTFLRDVDARLKITDTALHLGPIHTRMDRGTNVTVSGTIDNFPAADTYLKIEGKYGNIDEVIGLWLSDENRENKHKRRKRGRLEIDIKTEAGEISHLPFESSTAHISYRDRTLVIHPINFKYGDGFGTGQVLVNFRDDQPPLLQMSGHLENFDALAVYQQLLQRKGIVTGKLRGDFYLEGTAGNLKEKFLPTSFGSFSYEVQDGTLKKLKNLSRALTIFNIYPLFTSSGNEKGVPFEKLSGTATIDKGILQTTDMLMKGDVMNMSLSGKQNLITTELDFELGIMPLRTLDRLVTNIPLAGWVLTGENKALYTAHFKVTGPSDNPEITAIPIESTSKQVVGIFKRIFTLPVKIINDVGEALE